MFFFFNDTATTEIYTLSLHDALPICLGALFDEILGLGAQVWMTGTDSGLFEPLAGRAQFFSVAEATVTAVL